MGGYTETDGVYYDPNKDVIPEGIVMPEPNQVDEVYAYESDSASIIEQNQKNKLAQKQISNLERKQNLIGELTLEQNKTFIITIIILGVGILTDIIRHLLRLGKWLEYRNWFGWNNWGNNWGWNPYWDPYFGYGGYGYYPLVWILFSLLLWRLLWI